MKIRHKIAWIYTLLTSVVLFCAFSFIYYLTGSYAQSHFYSRLQGKAMLTAWKHFEEDELSKKSYLEVLDRYLQDLPDSKEIVLDTKNPRDIKDSLYPLIGKTLTDQLLDGKPVQFKIKHKQGYGIYYSDNQGNFIVIVTATDKFGIQKQQHLLRILLFIYLGSIVFVYFVGQFYAKRILIPLVHILKNIKRINATNLSLRLFEKKGNDELTELTRTFNQMLERLESSFEMQNTFIHNASHELKNPLTAILGETEVALIKERKPQEYISTLQHIQTEAERLNNMTKNLLDLAQADFNLSNMPLRPIRIDDLLWEIYEHFQKTIYRDRLDINMNNLPENAEYLTITGNYHLLRIALSNLIDNACKFSENQQVKITLVCDTSTIHVKITDQGIGIPKKEMSQLFQPFFRANNAVPFKGSGIGLSLANKIIFLHKGSLNITSVLGKGTAIDIEFPRFT